MTQQPIVILDNIRSLHNVGSIFRTADAAGIKQVIVVGITPHPRQPNDQRPAYVIDRTEQQLAKTALGAEQTLAIEYYESLSEAVQAIRAQGYAIYALEQAEGSQDLLSFAPHSPWALVVGHERDGVQQLEQMDAILEIPMRGNKESLNVSVATGIALYSLIKG